METKGGVGVEELRDLSGAFSCLYYLKNNAILIFVPCLSLLDIMYNNINNKKILVLTANIVN